MKLHALQLKVALLSYFRFKRQWICVDEYNGADVIVDTGKDIIEVEVKVDKKDLLKGEDRKKGKHHNYKAGYSWRWCHPNRYYFCVPTSLYEDAERKVAELNDSYGIIEFQEENFIYATERNLCRYMEDFIVVRKTARPLHKLYETKHQKGIAKRASSKLITLMNAEMRRIDEKVTQECQDA